MTKYFSWRTSIVLALAAPPFLARIFRLWETNSELQIYDIRGFVADFLVVMALSLIFLAFIKIENLKITSRVFLSLFAVIWSLVVYGNYEHIKALGVNASTSYIHYLFDPTFSSGSVLNASSPLLLAVVILIPVLALWRALRTEPSKSSILAAALAVLVAGVATSFWKPVSAAPLWRQQNFVLESLRWVAQEETLQAAKIDIPGLYPADLDGEPIVELGHPKTNVLLVVLEGVSGAYLDAVAARHEIEGPRPRLANLDRLARGNLNYTNFINHQRQTNRGIYSILCGDLPKLLTREPKMTEFAGSGSAGKLCLPEILRRHGYTTAYLQAAPLPFMGKDKFMPRAGYEFVHGTRWFNAAAADYGIWGVDDSRFFEGAQAYISDELLPQKEPWFLTLLTAGTHHPFAVPEDFLSSLPSGSFARAVDFLDHSLEGFIGFLEDSGLREDTLIIFTSDESYGLDGINDRNGALLAQAFGQLAILTPARDARVVDEAFMQMDVTTSVLDYLGYMPIDGDIGGRSVFRAYAKDRPIPISNTYMRLNSVVSADRQLTVCMEDFTACEQLNLQGWHLATARRELVELDAENIDLLKEVTERSLYAGELSNQVDWPLIGTDEDFLVGKKKTPAKGLKVFSGQYINLTKGSELEVEIEFEVFTEGKELLYWQNTSAIPSGKMPSGLEYFYNMQSGKRRSAVGIQGDTTLGMRPQLETEKKHLFDEYSGATPGERIRIHYKYIAEEELEQLSCLFAVMNETEHEAAIRFHKARLTVREAGAADISGVARRLSETASAEDRISSSEH